MKKAKHIRNTILLALLFSAMILGFWSCQLGVSIEQRVDSFISDLNDSRDSVYANFHPTATEDYDAIKPANTWLTWFPLPPPDYSISGLDTSDTRNVTAMIAGPGGFGGPWLITFRMLKLENDWYIEEMDLEGELNPIVQ